MGLRIICSGYIVRYPLGGLSWHHLQYLVGLRRLGHHVTFFEDYGWTKSCFNPTLDAMTADPSYGIAYLANLLRPFDLADQWSYLAEDGTCHGLSRTQLHRRCREADLYLNLSNINWIPELEECRRRVLIDTDPVFTQIGAHGIGGPFSRYDALFTYGENVHQPDCDMPTGGVRWLPTRQPIVNDLWNVAPTRESAPFTTVMNWSSLGDCQFEGTVYGQKERAFQPFFSLPRATGESMELAVKVPSDIRQQLLQGGWRIVDPMKITEDGSRYQSYLSDSKAEFSVAKHGYVITRCGWFSERSAAYLASGRPAVIQDTGFSRWLNPGAGVLPYTTLDEAIAAIEEVNRRYDFHCRAARQIAEEYFDADEVLSNLLEASFRDLSCAESASCNRVR